MDTLLLVGVTVALAYALGGVPFGYLVGRWRGVDIFRHGSGNIGATNVGRILGRPYGVLVFVLDFAKGAVPVALADVAARQLQPTAEPYLGVVAGLAAFLGHLFSPWLRFRGGKGVATGAGVVVVLLPVAALAAVVAWVVVVVTFRYVSAASVAAALVLCGVHLFITPEPLGADALPRTLFCGVAAALVVVRHRENLKRLAHGNENRLAETTAMLLLAKTLHVLAVGLWFGAAIFFSFVVGFVLFGTFEEQAQLGAMQREPWFPVAPRFLAEPGALKEQGTRAAGFAISPMFDIYYLLQGACAAVALVTALGWTKLEAGRRVHTIRVWVLGAALATLVVGFPLARHVSHLRAERNSTRDVHLSKLPPYGLAVAQPVPQAEVDAAREKMEAARKEFGMWHGVSLVVNLVTILLVTVGMALAAQLPAAVAPTPAPPPKPAEEKAEVPALEKR
jgi:acyl-phosphate glycerol 3-phosphate acyltransferase